MTLGELCYYLSSGAIQLFNLAYTSVPILLMAVYDMDISPDDAHKYPQTYMAGINNEYFQVSCTCLLHHYHCGYEISLLLDAFVLVVDSNSDA